MQRETFEKEELARSNKALYAILSKVYALFNKAVKDGCIKETAKQILTDEKQKMYHAENFINKKVNDIIGNQQSVISKTENDLSSSYNKTKKEIEGKPAYEIGDVVGDKVGGVIDSVYKDVKDFANTVGKIFPGQSEDDFNRYTKIKDENNNIIENDNNSLLVFILN